MNYVNSYGKTVKVLTDMDNGGRRIDTSLKYVVTFYVDSDSKTVGVYPLYEGGLTKEDVLSTQPVKHELNTEHLEELPY